jgi:hypothetical protein
MLGIHADVGRVLGCTKNVDPGLAGRSAVARKMSTRSWWDSQPLREKRLARSDFS